MGFWPNFRGYFWPTSSRDTEDCTMSTNPNVAANGTTPSAAPAPAAHWYHADPPDLALLRTNTFGSWTKPQQVHRRTRSCTTTPLRMQPVQHNDTHPRCLNSLSRSILVAFNPCRSVSSGECDTSTLHPMAKRAVWHRKEAASGLGEPVHTSPHTNRPLHVRSEEPVCEAATE